MFKDKKFLISRAEARKFRTKSESDVDDEMGLGSVGAIVERQEQSQLEGQNG